MNIKTQVLIVGGGTAGMFASVMCGMLGLDSVIIDAMSRLGGQCVEVYPEKYIYDIPGFFEVKAKDLIENLKKQMNRFSSIRTILQARLIEIRRTNDWIISLVNGDKIESKFLVFATGDGLMLPNRPNFDNLQQLEAEGHVQYFMNNLEQFKGKRVAVLGGGDSANDWCLTLAELADEVYLIHRRSTLRSMKSNQDELARKKNCFMFMNSELKEIKKSEQKVQLKIHKSTEDEIEYLEVDYVIPCYGIKSDNHFICNEVIDLDNHSRIKVDPATSLSNIPGIYGIGDASSYRDKNRLIVCGFGEAANAIYHIVRILDPTRNVPYSTSILNPS